MPLPSPQAAPAPAATVRVLHISDLHFAQKPNLIGLHHTRFQLRPLARWALQLLGNRFGQTSFTGTYDEVVASRLAAQVNGGAPALEVVPDIVVLTGDVATVGDRQHLRVARQWLSGEVSRQPVATSRRLATIPGNHDRFHTASHALLWSGSRHFEAPDCFGPAWDQVSTKPQSDSGYVAWRVFHKPGVADLKLAVVGADFSLSLGRSVFNTLLPPARQYDWGQVYPDILDELQQATQQLRQSGHAVVWSVHYPPRFPRGRDTLRHSQRLVDAAARCGVRYILSGHTHDQCQYSLPARDTQPVHILCAGSATCLGGEANAFYIHEFDLLGDQVQGCRSRHFEWDAQANFTGGFVERP